MAYKLILFLGNIGSQYNNTPHNMGFEVGDAYAKKIGKVFDKKAKNSRFFVDGNIVCAKPTTFMNLSGRAALELMGKFKIRPQDVLAVYDDYDLPSGTVRHKEKGSGGTHNGARDLVIDIGEDFQKLKIGVRPDEMKLPLINFVTAKIVEESERKKLDEAIFKAVEEVIDFAKS